MFDQEAKILVDVPYIRRMPTRFPPCHKRRSSVRKSKKDAIGSHLIQAADNVPRKLKFHFLITFHTALLNSKCHIDLVTVPSKGFIQGFFEIQIFLSQGKYVCGLFGEQSERILGGQK